MSEIRLLPSDVIDQIAAGEVIERPANLVKELIENSLDAGATSILVEIDHGGRQVRVTDDGDGIHAEDLPSAFARHATSKIARAEDLFKLGSFGFRGEAIASIASVAKVSIRSRRRNSSNAFEMSADFGRLGPLLERGSALGTVVEVDELFENLPARLKFMKSEASEVTQIKNVVKAFALSFHTVDFRLRVRDELEFAFQVRDSWESRVKEVLGLQDMYFADRESEFGRAEVMFASPKTVAKNSRQIWLFVQGRWVQDKNLQFAVQESYRSLLMHGEYPIVVVKLQLPTDSVDINVHPAKSQVRFQQASGVFKLVHGALRDGLEKAPWIPKNTVALTEPLSPRDEISNSPSFLNEPVKQYNLINHALPANRPMQVEFSQAFEGNSQTDSVASTHYAQKSSLNLDVLRDLRAPSPGYWGGLQVLGQARLTYIVAQADDKLVLVDQHAAHERVAFEKLMRGYKEGPIETQGLLLPLTLEMESSQVQTLVEMRDELLRSGIEVDEMGPNILAIRSLPSFIRESALVSALQKLAQQKVEFGGGFALEKKIGDLFATMACHSVVRAGQAMSIAEMQALLKQMDEFPLSSFCPHGRPVSVDYSWSELERAFGRIV